MNELNFVFYFRLPFTSVIFSRPLCSCKFQQIVELVKWGAEAQALIWFVMWKLRNYDLIFLEPLLGSGHFITF